LAISSPTPFSSVIGSFNVTYNSLQVFALVANYK
jgi:hypothetical protein